MSDLVARRQLNHGYSDGLSRAIEIAVTPLVFGGIGFLLDAWVGTRPLFTLLVGTLGVVGTFVKLWLGYDREMREHEAKGPYAPRTVPVPGYLSTTKAAFDALRGTTSAPAATDAAKGTDTVTDAAAERAPDGGRGS